MKKIFSHKFGLVAAIFYFVCISSLYAVMSLVKHSHYETFGDLGIFNQGIWQYSQFKFPFTTFHLNRFWLGDHFHPLMAALAPFYWLYSSEKTLLVLQPFLVLSAIVPLYLIGYRLTKSVFFSLAVILAYSLYIPLQYTIFFDFHEIILVPPLFTWTYYFFLRQKKTAAWIFLFLLLLVKEEVGFFVATFGLYLFLFHKEWRKFGLFWLIFGAGYSLIVVAYVIPKIGGDFIYSFGSVGKSPLEIGLNFLRHPIKFLSFFFDAPIKLETLRRSFWPFAYLPLISPLGLLLSFEQFFTRFVDQENTTRWTIGYHYSAIIAIVLPIATIWVAGFYSNLFPRYRKLILFGLGVLLIFLTRIEQINASAVFLVKRPQFWAREPWMDNIDQALKLVPKDASVATQRNIVAHVSTRMRVYRLTDLDNQASYILAEFHPGQTNYNFYAINNWQEIEAQIKAGIKSGKYQAIYQKDDTYLVRVK